MKIGNVSKGDIVINSSKNEETYGYMGLVVGSWFNKIENIPNLVVVMWKGNIISWYVGKEIMSIKKI